MFGMTKFYKHNPSVPDDEVTPEYTAENTFVVGSVRTGRQARATYDQVGGFGHLLILSSTTLITRAVEGRCGCWPRGHAQTQRPPRHQARHRSEL